MTLQRSFPKSGRRNTGPTRKVRELVNERDGAQCVMCGAEYGVALNHHHRLRRSQGGKHVPSNLVTLCGSGTTGCHGWVHARVDDARDMGLLLRSGDDPRLAPVLTWQFGSVWLDDDGGWTTEPPEEKTQ